MTDNLAVDSQRGAEAAALLKHPLFVESFAKLELDFINAWKSAGDVETRERLWSLLQCLYLHRTFFHSLVNSGKLSDREMSELKAGSSVLKFQR